MWLQEIMFTAIQGKDAEETINTSNTVELHIR